MKVLIVEDETQLRLNLEQGLKEQGFSVETAVDGVEALYKLTTYDYDAAILDIVLPAMGGWEVLERARESKSTPILVLTARDSVSDRVRGLDGGADDYLVKPFHLEELYSRLRALIRRSRGKPNPIIRVGGITLDTLNRTVSRDGQNLSITSLEYALVETLFIRRGELVTRSFLYENVMDEDSEAISDSLYVHICRLRKKLGRDVIKTRPGFGYFVPFI